MYGKLGTLTISSGQTDSNIITTPEDAGHFLVELAIESPATLTGTVTLYAANDPASTPKILQINGTDQTVPANRVTVYAIGGACQIQVKSGSAEGATRTFTVWGSYLTSR